MQRARTDERLMTKTFFLFLHDSNNEHDKLIPNPDNPNPNQTPSSSLCLSHLSLKPKNSVRRDPTVQISMLPQSADKPIQYRPTQDLPLDCQRRTKTAELKNIIKIRFYIPLEVLSKGVRSLKRRNSAETFLRTTNK